MKVKDNRTFKWIYRRYHKDHSEWYCYFTKYGITSRLRRLRNV